MDDEILDCARQAEDALRRLARITIDRPSRTPADIDAVIASLAEAVAALPQAVSQLGDMLRNTQEDWHLSMDSMSGTRDPSVAIDTAGLHLDVVRRAALEVHRHLDAAHQDTAHIAAEERWVPGVLEPPRPAQRPDHRPPPPSRRPLRPGPSR
jgi:hypothetical protein